MATITKEPIGLLHEKISVKIEKADYFPSFEKSLKEYSKKASIQGFRPGKVPAGLIKKMYGPSLFTDEVLKTVDKELIDYLQNEKAEIFAQPLPLETDMAKLDVNNPVEYTFDFEIGRKPEFSLTDLATADITAYNIDITEEMVNDEVNHLQTRYADMVEKDSAENDENVLNLSFTEADNDGNAIENGVSKSSSIAVKSFTKKIKDQLIGKKVNDSLVITLGDAFEGNDLESITKELGLTNDDVTKAKFFNISISKISEMKKKELNEEFFNQLFPNQDVKTEEDLRGKLKENVFNYFASQSRNQIQDQIFHKLVENTTIEFPEAFLKKWLTVQNGQDGQPTKTEEEIEKGMPAFLNSLKWTLITDKIVKDENIQVGSDEIKSFAKNQLFNYMGGMMASDDEQPWINDYVEKMMKDRKYVEETYHRLQSEKVFEWAEKQIKPTSKQISAEDFTKMVQEHQHTHHH
ncbi:MAG: trigger factor [Niabella sp.]|nr:MAG: trigger factor [Niabella sp.]